MKLNDIASSGPVLPNNESQAPAKKEEMAMEFERMFARQLVQEMTKGLFKQDDKQSMMSSGSEMYRSHIVDTLSEALAQQEKLGMSDMISKHWNLNTGETAPNTETESKK